MAEFPELGKHCSLKGCNQLDFLPFNCDQCGMIFCNEHYKADSHLCTTPKEITTLAFDTQSWTCEVENCKVIDQVEMLCQGCNKHFCLKHRHGEDHDCPSWQKPTEEEIARCKLPGQKFQEAKAEVDRHLMKKLNEAKKRPKSSKIAAQVQLMKLKGKAVGQKSLPAEERVYFLIYLPLELNQGSKPVFVSKHWSVGKVIDTVATLVSVKNRNNELHAPKLRLFRYGDGAIVSAEMGQSLSELVQQDVLVNGESLILEYVPESVPSLENMEAYQ